MQTAYLLLLMRLGPAVAATPKFPGGGTLARAGHTGSLERAGFRGTLARGGFTGKLEQDGDQ